MGRSIAVVVVPALPSATIRWGSLVPLVAASLAIMGSPGPATISIVATSSAHGVRRSLGYVAGIVVGTAIVLVAVAAGITTTLAAVPGVRATLLAASAAYIVWLAYRIATAATLGARHAAPAAPSFAGGAFLGIANPKAWVAIAAVFASVRLSGDSTADAVAKVAVLSGMIVLIMVAWLIAGGSLAGVLRDPRRARVVNVVLAAALVGATGLAIIR